MKQMTEQQKQLVFIDLCGRLPYHPLVKIWEKDGYTESGELDLLENYENVLRKFLHGEIKIKPYLFPQSEISNLIGAKEFTALSGYQLIDWYNANHIDYRDLIPMGLAYKRRKTTKKYIMSHI